MSTLAVNTVTDANGGNTATINSMTPTADSLQGFRNRILNGDCRIDQRNAGAAVTANGAYPVDRFSAFNTTDGAFSAQQDASAPDGFVSSLKYTATTADGTLATTQTTGVVHHIEGYNVADLGFGAAGAQTVTLSFWVRSSLTGTFGGALRNGGTDRSYPFSYSISSADTWEYKTVSVAGDTSGTWLTTNGRGLSVLFGLGSGPDRSGTAGAWAAANVIQPTGTVSVISTLNATWYVTGVQLEVGSVATPFERRPYGQELSLCQRYYQFVGGESPYNYLGTTASITSTTTAFLPVPLQVTMRATPTFTYAGALSNFDLRADGNTTHTPTALANDQFSSKICGVTITTTGITANTPGILIGANSTASKLIFSAEL